LLRQAFHEADEMGKRGCQGRRNSVQRWDWDVVINEWADQFQRLLESRNRERPVVGEIA